jgi:hypothetical protein
MGLPKVRSIPPVQPLTPSLPHLTTPSVLPYLFACNAPEFTEVSVCMSGKHIYTYVIPFHFLGEHTHT